MTTALHIIGVNAVQLASEHVLIPLTINGLDVVLPGLPRGSVSELTGAASSGRATLLHAFLATATTLGEVCAVVDVANSFDPVSAVRAGVDLKQLLWIQCNRRIDHALKAADLLLHGGGFGLVILDLCEVQAESLQRVPISYWHRFRLAVKNTSTAFVVAGNQANARSCATRQLELQPRCQQWSPNLLSGLILSIHSRKPVQRETAELQADFSGE